MIWLSEKRSMFVKIVDMNLRNGWANVLGVIIGIRWWKKLKQPLSEENK